MRDFFQYSVQLVKAPRKTSIDLYQFDKNKIVIIYFFCIVLIYSLLSVPIYASSNFSDILIELISNFIIGIAGNLLNILTLTILLFFSSKIFNKRSNFRKIFLGVVWSFGPFILLMIPISSLIFFITLLVGKQVIHLQANILNFLPILINYLIVISLIVKIIYQVIVIGVAVETSIGISFLIHVVSMITGLIFGFFIVAMLNGGF